MKHTGYGLQLIIKDLKREVETYTTQFDSGKTKFADEDKPTVGQAYQEFRKAEESLALYQTAQSVFNQRVFVTVQGQRMTLARAIKLVGGAGRGEAMWRAIVAPKKDRYMRDETTSRDNDKTYATPTYTMEEAKQKAKEAAAYASALRQAIQEANAQELEILETEL